MRPFLLPLVLHFHTCLPVSAQGSEASLVHHPAYAFQWGGRMRQDPADSADFAQFVSALAGTDLDIGPLPYTSEYRLVWEVTCEGGTRLSRGNGADLASFLKDPPEKRFMVPVCCPRFFGGRYAVVHWEPPTGLVRFHYWFFERR